LWVHDRRRGGEKSEAESREQQYFLHGNLTAVSAVAALATATIRHC
jgi:hypothetical protein